MSGSLILLLMCVVWQITVWKSKTSRQNVEPQVLALTSWETLAKALNLTQLHHSVIYKVVFFPLQFTRDNILQMYMFECFSKAFIVFSDEYESSCYIKATLYHKLFLCELNNKKSVLTIIQSSLQCSFFFFSLPSFLLPFLLPSIPPSLSSVLSSFLCLTLSLDILIQLYVGYRGCQKEIKRKKKTLCAIYQGIYMFTFKFTDSSPEGKFVQ